MEIRLTRGSEILALSGGTGTIIACTYYQQSAASADEEISETIEVVLEGTQAAMLDDIRSLERMLIRAEQRQDQTILAEHIYLEWDVDDSGVWYRSELLAGRVERSGIMRHLRAGAMAIGLIYTRKNFFEASAETALALTNPNGAAVTSGLRLYNCNDLSGTAPNVRANYADIVTTIDGVLPAPAHIEITNLYNHIWLPNRFYVAVNRNSWKTGVAAAHWLEASGYASASASGGAYNEHTFTDNNEALVDSWAISSAEANRLAGNYFHALIRFMAIQAAQQVKFNVGLTIGTQSSKGPTVRLGDARLIQDLGVIRIPPAWSNPAINFGAITFNLYGTRLSDGDKLIQYDYIMLAPVDGYRIYSIPPVGSGLALNEKLVDSADNPAPYIDAAGVFSRPWVAMGEHLMLHPGQSHRIMMLHESANGTDANPARNISLKAFYRPRRKSL